MVFFYINPKGYFKNKVRSGYNSKFFERIQLTTVALPVFTKYHNLFYKLYNGKYIKIIPLNIEEILTPVSLAFFLMGDSSYNKTRKINTISTNNFTKEEVQLLSVALFKKIKIESRLELVKNNSYILIIRTSQVFLLQELVKDHMHPSMLYRIGIVSLGKI
jgi:LAGLIDADG DNA endonuclease family